MITVIIPALNEEKTVASVVRLAKQSPNVSEVIVVDDRSIDNTIYEARKEGANVITSSQLGKGISMKEGVAAARNEILAFLDADIVTYPKNVIELLTAPILKGEADFVKSFFKRQAGRVTELVAKPLLSLLHPGFPDFQQPLSGMIAGRKSYFEKTEFEEGYGVDIGILMDMYNLGARIMEVNIGFIENRLQELKQLGRMSREVAKTIMKKTAGWVHLGHSEVKTNLSKREELDQSLLEMAITKQKIAILDMDNTIFRKSFLITAAEDFGFMEELVEVVSNNRNPFVRTKKIAKLFSGKTKNELISLASGIPVTKHLDELLKVLRKKGYIIGIISDSYDCITQYLQNSYGFDFTIANELEFTNDVCSGEVRIPSIFLQDNNSECDHEYCKMNALSQICQRFSVDLNNTLVIGDGENDICSLKNAGIGIAFCPNNQNVEAAANFVVKEPDFKEVIALL